MKSKAVAALEIADEEFLVASLIERCPKTMMIRELTMNALEAARLAPKGERFVAFGVTEIDRKPKLTIWNTGPGMDGPELLRICDIASSIGKEKSLTGNFGMGAKVASLPSNQRGMRYRSCKNHRVHEVILCKRDGVYGRLRRHLPNSEEYLEVFDVTDIAASEGRSLERDWTEVVLYGNEWRQNTVRDPYNADPPQDAQWLATYLYHRFYRLPGDVKVMLWKGTNKLGDSRPFLPITSRLNVFEKYETVATSHNIKIHYIFDAPYDKSGHNRSVSGAVASAVSTCAIVYRDELYDLRKGRKWAFDAPVFGIPFGAKHISVHIELPSNYQVVPDGYRQFLRYAQGEQPHVQASDFAELVRENRPQWLIDTIRRFSPDSATSDEIRDELQRLLNHLRIKRISPRDFSAGKMKVADAVENGFPFGEQPADSKSGRSKVPDLTVLPLGAKRAEMFKNLERAPEIIPLTSDADIEEKGIKGRAARYVMEAGQLFVNMQYPAVAEMRTQLETEFADASDAATMRVAAKQHAERTMILRVGRAVVFALAKQLNRDWDREALETAASPESLSMAADDFEDSLQNVRKALVKALRPGRIDTVEAA
jgi:hypothetical protein